MLVDAFTFAMFEAARLTSCAQTSNRQLAARIHPATFGMAPNSSAGGHRRYDPGVLFTEVGEADLLAEFRRGRDADHAVDASEFSAMIGAQGRRRLAGAAACYREQP